MRVRLRWVSIALAIVLVGQIPARSVGADETNSTSPGSQAGASCTAKPVSSDPPLWEQSLPTAKVSSQLPASDPGCVREVGRTANGVVWRNPDGSLTARAYASPVNFKAADGSWQGIDTRLLSDAHGGMVNRAGPFNVHFGSETSSSSLVTVGAQKVSLSFAFQGAVNANRSIVAPTDAPGVVAGDDSDTMTYAGAMSNVDVRYQLLAEQLKEAIVLRAPLAAGVEPRFQFSVHMDGLKARTADDGAVQFVDASTSKVVFSIPTGIAFDASGDAEQGVAAASTPVAVTLVPGADASTATLVVSVDGQWLSDPARVFPVTIDPTLDNTDGIVTDDAYTADTASTTTFNGSGQLNGTEHWDRAGNASSTNYHSWLQVPDMTFLAGKDVISATWNGYAYSIGGGSSVAVTLKPASASWSTSSVTWSAEPALRSNSATATFTAGSQWQSATITSWVQNWADVTWAQDGIRLSGPTTKYANIAAAESPSTLQSHVDVTFNSYPTQSLPKSGGLYADSKVKTATPTLSAQIDDVDTDNMTDVFGDFEVWNSNHTTRLNYGAGSHVAAGSRSSYTSGSLSDGSYTWRVKADDGTSQSAWSGWQSLTVDTVAPATPTSGCWWTWLTCAFAANTWTTTSSGATLGFYESPTSDASQFLWGIDVGDNPTNITGCCNVAVGSGMQTVPNIPRRSGWHDIAVRAIDAAGNVSSVHHFAYGAGDGGFVTPTKNFETQKFVDLVVKSKTAYDGLTVEWRRGPSDGWNSLPLGDTRYKSTNSTITGWPITATPGTNNTEFPSLVWDAASTATGLDGSMQLRAVFSTGGVVQAYLDDPADPTVMVNQSAAGSASASVGPGQVDLLTGDFQLSSSDVSLAGGVVARTFDSRDQNATGSVFGPGWKSNINGSSPFQSLTDNDGNAVVTGTDGSELSFPRLTKAPSALPYTFAAPDGVDDLTLTQESANEFKLVQTSGATYGFKRYNSTTKKYLPNYITDVAGQTSPISQNLLSGTSIVQTLRITGPDPDSSTDCSLTTVPKGCQVLTFDYATATASNPSTCGGSLGDVNGQLRKVSYTAYDPDVPAVRTVDVAIYCYDTTTSRLRAEWDPRLSTPLKTTYTYDSNGHISTFTPPGQDAFTFTYAPLSGETPSSIGRLATIARPEPSPGTGTAITTMAYAVPLTVAGGGPNDMTPTDVASWAQRDTPTTATGIYPPDPTGGSPSGYARATVSYIDSEGQIVNVADPNGGISTSEYDAIGHIVRTLTAGNRARALASSSDPLEQAAQALLLDSHSVYDSEGFNVTDTYGPAHVVDLPDATQRAARAHVQYFYDEGSPSGDTYGLVTTQTETAAPITGSPDQDERATSYDYADAYNTGWKLGTPLKTIVDPGSSPHLNLTTTTLYDHDTGLLTERRLPAGPSGGDAHTTKFIYYTAGTNPQDSACSNKVEWLNLPCKTLPAAQPGTSGLPNLATTQVTKYNMYGQPEQSIETNGGDTRTANLGYDAVGRPTTKDVDSTVATDIPQVTTSYSTTTGLPTTTTDGTLTIARAYDTHGRVTSYQDGSGTTTSYTYDLLDRPLAASYPIGSATYTTNYSYDGSGETRGLLTGITDTVTVASTTTTDAAMTATYDTDGQLATQSYPSTGTALTATTTRDEVGEPTSLTYVKNANDWWPNSSATYDIHGQQKELFQPFLFQDDQYEYDPAGRLAQTTDSGLLSCHTRQYTFDADSNRTNLTTYYGGIFSGPCPPTSSYSKMSSFDSADRITTSGTTYDAFGRTTFLPAADAANGHDTTLTYFNNDLVRTTANDGKTLTYTLDPDRNVRTWNDGVNTHTNHYTADTDSPAWTTENSSGTDWIRNLTGFAGLIGTIDQAGAITLQLANLHGDIVAQATTSSAGFTNGQTTDEYGVAITSGGSTGQRYDYVGTAQRQRDVNSGLQLMGQRVYNSTTGRFLQTDPLLGGSANDYDYVAGDPVNRTDTAGRGVLFTGLSLWGYEDIGHGCTLHSYAHITPGTQYFDGFVQGSCSHAFEWQGFWAADEYYRHTPTATWKMADRGDFHTIGMTRYGVVVPQSQVYIHWQVDMTGRRAFYKFDIYGAAASELVGSRGPQILIMSFEATFSLWCGTMYGCVFVGGGVTGDKGF